MNLKKRLKNQRLKNKMEKRWAKGNYKEVKITYGKTKS